MNIQVITNSKKRYLQVKGIVFTYSEIGSPKTFDSYDINIIDLQYEEFWRNHGLQTDVVNNTNDLKSLKKLITESKKAINIVALSQNYIFRYNYDIYHKGYQNDYFLKDRIDAIQSIISKLLPRGCVDQNLFALDMFYENAKTKCNNTEYESAFLFDNKGITKSIGSNRSTTIQIMDRCYITTLDLSGQDIKDFLIECGFYSEQINIPEWVKNIEFNDDFLQLETIQKNKEIINEAKSKIEIAQKIIDKNLLYKSILVETGNNLVKVVFEILEKILVCNLSDFEDKKQEDFLIKKEDVTFIGEIKGIGSNVKNENISQLDVHFQTYIDSLKEGQNENVKALLIIAPLRDKKLEEREPVKDTQIKLAERNKSLIITTDILLKLFENFLKNKITNDKIIEMLKNKIGILTEKDFIG